MEFAGLWEVLYRTDISVRYIGLYCLGHVGVLYCKLGNFHERFIFANALSNSNLKHAKISTQMH
jgi:hypothetical protein